MNELIPEYAQPVINRIHAEGGHVYLAGGAVRDIVNHMEAKDLDLEVYDIPVDTLIHILRDYGSVDTVGTSFGIIMLNNPQFPRSLEFSIPRRENKEGRGHRGFIMELDPTMSTFEATRRRDFTMNSMLIDLQTSTLIDHHGGRDDLSNYLLRATSEAYMEDPLRVLRGFQFCARFDLWPTGETITMSKHMLEEAHTLSIERIWGEWYKWALYGEKYASSLDYLRATGWIRLWPELAALRGVEQDPIWHPEGDVWEHTKKVVQNAHEYAVLMGYSAERRIRLIFSALLHDIGKPLTAEIGKTGRHIHPKHETVGVDIADKFLTSIGAPGWVGEHVRPLIQEHMFRRGRMTGEKITKRSIRRLSTRLIPASISELSGLMQADAANRVQDLDPFIDSMLSIARILDVEAAAPKKILTGNDLITFGLTPGPKFGIILNDAYEAQLDGVFEDHFGAVQWLGEYLEHHEDMRI